MGVDYVQEPDALRELLDKTCEIVIVLITSTQILVTQACKFETLVPSGQLVVAFDALLQRLKSRCLIDLIVRKVHFHVDIIEQFQRTRKDVFEPLAAFRDT